jgi:CRP-like cAMP-binding protein
MVSTLSLNLSTESTLSMFTRRSLLPLKRDVLWKIKTGVVRTLTLLEDGTSITLGVWGPGDVVGRIFSKAEPLQIECLTPVEATLVHKNYWQNATEELILHIQRSGELIEILQCRQAEFALLRLFSWLAERFGQEVEQGQLIDLRLTHQDIAEIIGLTRVTVTRLLNSLEKQGLFSVDSIVLSFCLINYPSGIMKFRAP